MDVLGDLGHSRGCDRSAAEPATLAVEAGEQMKRAEKLLRAFARACEHPARRRQAFEDADALFSMRLKWGRP